MKKRGFTLVELLAVIVVIAIIALIATPTTLGIVEKSRRQTFENSAYKIIESADIYLMNNINTIQKNKTIIFECNGKVCTDKENNLDIKGKIPVKGSIIISGNKQVRLEFISDGKYCAYGTEDDLTIAKDCSDLDATEAVLDETKLYISSTTNSIKVSILEDFARDPESGIKKYQITLDKETKQLTDIGSVTFKNLKKNTTYPIEIKVENGKELVATLHKEATTLDFKNPQITFLNTPKVSSNGYLKSQTAQIVYSNSKVNNLSYYVKTTREGISNLSVTKSCGNGVKPTTCSDITNTTKLEVNTWYQVKGNINVVYNKVSNDIGTIYAYTSDGVNYSSAATGTISKIDTTGPTITVKSIATKTNNATVRYELTDNESGIGTVTCKYGTKNGIYDKNGIGTTTSCQINNLVKNTTYYYEICAMNKIGINNCIIGSTKPSDITNPRIDLENIPSTSQSGYLKKQIARVVYNIANVSNPEYFVKTTRDGISNILVNQSCGNGITPTNCSNITNTTALKANTWYKVSGNINVTYDSYSNQTDTIYAYTYDGTNKSGTATATISKITKSVNYRVNHYQMNVSGSGYSLKETEVLRGSLGYSETPNTKNYIGFISPTTQTVNISEDGSTVVNYYYTRKKYTISLSKGNGIYSVGGAGTYYYGDSVNLEANPITGYHFTSWSGTYNTGSFTMPAGNVTMTANGAANTYYIVYNGNGANSGSMGTTTCTYGQPCSLLNLGYSKLGYHFTLWRGSNRGYYSNGQSVTNLTTTNGATITMYANWSGNTYYIVYNGNGADSGGMGITTCIYGQNCTLAGLGYGRTGYRFNSWSGSNGGSYWNGQTVSNLTPTNGATITMKAVWQVNQYTVTVNKGTGIASVSGGGTYNYGSSVKLKYTLSTGYHFKSWSGDYKKAKFTMPAKDVTIKANGEANTYTINYDGVSIHFTTCVYDSDCIIGDASGIKNGRYEFDYWSGSNGKKYSSGQKVKNLTSKDGGVLTMTAKWKLQSPYTINLKSNLYDKQIDVTGYSKVTLKIAKGGHDGYQSYIEIKQCGAPSSLKSSYSGSGGRNTITANIPANTTKLCINAWHQEDKYHQECKTKHKVTVTLTK